MIVRLWKGRVASDRAAEYRIYQERVGPPGYRVVPGVRWIYMLGRECGPDYEVAFLTVWESLEAIRAFAGQPVDRARYYERDFEFLIDPPEKVDHFEVLEAANLDFGPQRRERIARLWRGKAPLDRKAEAVTLEPEIAVPAYLAVDGNAGIYILGRDAGEEYEVATLTFWESLESIRAFAGDPPDRARYDDYHLRGATYLSSKPEHVEHFDVLIAEHVPTK